MNRVMKTVWGMVLLISEFALATPKFDEWVYRDGEVERAEFVCGRPQSQRNAPKFTSAEGAERAVRAVNHYTLIIGTAPPLTSIGTTDLPGTFWQLDNETFRTDDGNDVSGYVYFNCDGQKYFAFNVYAKGRGLAPIMRVAVPEDDTSIFKGAQVVSDDAAAIAIDPNQVFQTVAARVNTKPAAPPVPRVPVAQIPSPNPRPPQADFTADDDEPLALRPFDTLGLAVPMPKPRPSQAPAPAPAPAPAANDGLSDMESYDRAAVWHGQTRQSLAWTTASIKLFRQHWSQLSRADDIGDFCPGYRNATRKQQEICWLRIIGGIVKFESDFRPASKMRESTGVWSVGLMAMSIGQCPGLGSVSALQQAIPNLECGISDFAKWTADGGSISSRSGAGRNWSTLRNPYTAYVAGKRIVVGKKKQIESIAMGFKRY